jgi:hypothetical protein
MTQHDGELIAFICETCGTQHTAGLQPPERCAICDDERQYVGSGGQRWTTLERLAHEYEADIREEEPSLLGIGMTPSFAIGQRALLLQSPDGNVLWDCIPLLDERIFETVSRLGGISAIAISHPHYYSTMVEWADAFDATVYLHQADAQWVMRPDSRVVLWAGERRELAPDIVLVRLGGHYAGGTVLHWRAGQGGRGALLSGDIVQVVADRRWVSFMRSYPNLIPLSAVEVQRVVDRLAPYSFERIYGAWYGRVVERDGEGAVQRSAARYVRALDAGLEE